MPAILAGVDVGTTSARCALFDFSGKLLCVAAREYGAEYVRPGWVDQDAALLIERTFEACREAVAASGVSASDIASIGFSSQRSVTCPIDADGRLVRPMISWQDARTAREVEQIAQRISGERYSEITGLPLGTTWILTKLLWMRNNEPDLYRKTVRFVQNQDLILKAFGADAFLTDRCGMGFYGLWDVRNGCWSEELLSLFELEAGQFGEPCPPGTQVGTVPQAVARKSGFAPGTPICVGAGDQNCAVVGMGAVRPGIATVTLGTAGLAILTTDRPVGSVGGMMVTHHALPNHWEVEGLSNAAAASLRWYRDTVGWTEKAAAELDGDSAYCKLDRLAAEALPGSKGLLFMPYLSSAASPRWNPDARASFLGLSFAHGRAELTRAVMEGVVLEVRDMMECWMREGLQVDALRLAGGATRSDQWNRIQANVYGRPVQVMADETTVLGAALLGGVGAGVFGSIAEGVEQMVHAGKEIEPDMNLHSLYNDLYDAYAAAYHALAAPDGTYAKLARLQ